MLVNKTLIATYKRHNLVSISSGDASGPNLIMYIEQSNDWLRTCKENYSLHLLRILYASVGGGQLTTSTITTPNANESQELKL